MPPIELLAIRSIERVRERAVYAPFQVGGNGRYLLADGTLTHNTAGYWSPEVLCKTGTYNQNRAARRQSDATGRTEEWSGHRQPTAQTHDWPTTNI